MSISSTAVDCDMFADDLSLSASGNNIAAINAKLQPSIQEVTEWCSTNAMLLNPEKTKIMVVATRQNHQRCLPPSPLMLNSQVIEQVSEHRHLGVILDDQLIQAHTKSITNAVAKMCICYLASDTFVTMKLVIHFFTRTLRPEFFFFIFFFFFPLRAHNQHVDYSGAYNWGCSLLYLLFINYVSNVWDSCTDIHIKNLQSLQKRAVKVLCAASPMLT